MTKPRTIGDIKIKDIKKVMLQLFVVGIIISVLVIIFGNSLYSSIGKI